MDNVPGTAGEPGKGPSRAAAGQLNWEGPQARDYLHGTYEKFRAWTKRAYRLAAERGDEQAIAMLGAIHEDLDSRLRAAIGTMRDMEPRGLPGPAELYEFELYEFEPPPP